LLPPMDGFNFKGKSPKSRTDDYHFYDRWND